MNLTTNVIAQVKAIRSQVDAQCDALIDLLEAMPAAEGSTPARVPAKGNRCPHCDVSNPTRETSGGFGSGEETTRCGHCGEEL